MTLTQKTKVKMFGDWFTISRIDLCEITGKEYFTLNNNVNTVSREYIESNTTDIIAA